jgi:predicted CXXCH cytochrome family protein
MKTTIAAGLALAPVAALLLWSAPARSEMWSDDALARETSACALGRTSRAQASSRGCLSCHDGLAASAVSYTFGRGSGSMHGSHPVDVDYGAAELRPGNRFRPPGALPASIVLPGGKVGCVSCHDGASPERYHTALPMDRSRLCFSCHDL